MRFLHPRLPDARRRRAGRKPRHVGRRDQGRAVVKPLPLHRLSEHRQGGSDCRARVAGGAPRMSYIGRPLRRIEDGPLLLGKGSFAADCNAPGQLHMRIVRSPVAFGRILGVETAEAAALEGVVAIWTSADVAELPPIDFRQMGLEALAPY